MRAWFVDMAAHHRPLLWLGGGVLGTLLLATAIAVTLRLILRGERHRRVVTNLLCRVLAWWPMSGLVFLVCFLGRGTTIIFFALIGFQALREYITVTNTRRADQRSLFWAFFVLLPLQFYLVDLGDAGYGLFTILIPVYAFVLFAIFGTLRGDATRYLERSAKIQWGLITCIYFVSHIPFLLNLNLVSDVGVAFDGSHGELIFFLLIVAQGNDILQYCWGTLLGRHRITPRLSPNKTWEGLVGGVVSATGLAAALWWLTPCRPAQAALMGLGIALMGFAGDIVMSAIKRDAGIKDYGRLIAGHGGILDRIDGLCFAAPIFFHLMRWYFDAGPMA